MARIRTLWAGLIVALLWLTRLPLGRLLPASPPPLGRALWAFPLVGGVVGAAGSGALLLACGLGLPPVVGALIAVAAQIWLTGGLHEDGLADFADGMGGATRPRRLEIMRDSRIGSHGTLALGLAVALRVAALAAMPPAAAAAGLLVAGAMSRAGIVALLAILPPARTDGSGRAAGRAGLPALAGAFGLVFAVCAGISALPGGAMPGPMPGPGAWVAGAIACLAAQGYVARLAARRLGGQTGDVLGAAQQAGESVIYVTIAAFLA